MTFITVGFSIVLPVLTGIWRFPVTRGAVGTGVGTALSMARDAQWCAGIRRCSRDSVAEGTLRSEIAGIRDVGVVVEILNIVGWGVVAVVAGRLVAEADVDAVTVHTDGFLR